jgi:hypothetical protein
MGLYEVEQTRIIFGLSTSLIYGSGNFFCDIPHSLIYTSSYSLIAIPKVPEIVFVTRPTGTISIPFKFKILNSFVKW